MNIFSGISIPKVLYSVNSEHNGLIEVYQIGNTRKIKVGGIDQSLNYDSPVCKRLVWGKAADLLKKEEPELKNVLVLGLGGATMQHLISQANPNAKIVSVELDSHMVQISKDYFDLDKIPNHTVITNDACRVVVEPEEFGLHKNMFQAVIVDIYVGEKFPELGTSGNFLAAVRDMVLPGGLVIINRIYIKTHQEDVDNFIEFVSGFLNNVQTEVVAGYTNSDNILIYGRT